MPDETAPSSTDTPTSNPADQSHPMLGLGKDAAELWMSIFRDLLPVAIQVQDWKRDGKHITDTAGRVGLAATWADYAVLEAMQRVNFEAKEG